jgi:putative holliday junction resolvase
MEDDTEFIAVDVGKVRVGFARGSTLARLAEPLFSVPANEALAKLVELAAELKTSGVVVGWPRNLSGKETAQTKTVRQWAVAAKAKINLPFYITDEALTSRLAQAQAATKKQKFDEHALAAAIFLQDFLDSPEGSRALV